MATDRTSPFGAPLAPYLALLEDLCDGSVDVAEFDDRYSDAYLNDKFPWPARVFEILDHLFFAADNCEQNADPGNSWAVTPEQLLDEAREAQNELREYKYLL